MPARRKLMLPFTHWPIEDRRRWEAAFQSGDLFDENGAGTRLAAATRHLRLESYGRFLGFLSVKHPKLRTLPPEERIDRRMAAEYVAHRRRVMRRHIVSCRSPQPLQHTEAPLP